MTQASAETGSNEAGSNLSAIARGGALNMLGSLIAGLSTFVVTLVVTNAWDAATAGTLFSLTSVFMIVVALAVLGTDTALARFVLGLESRNDTGAVRMVIRIALQAATFAGLAAGVLLAVTAVPVADLLGLSASAAPVVRVLALAVPLAVLTEVCLAATRAYGVMRTTALIDRVVRTGLQIITVGAAALLGTGMLGLAVAWAVPYVVSALLAPWALSRLMNRRGAVRTDPSLDTADDDTADDDTVDDARRALRREFWSFAWPRALARVGQVGLQRADIIMVAALRSPTEAALYTAATRFVVIGQLGVQAVQQVLQPRLAHLISTGSTQAMHEVFRTTTTWIVALAWPVYLSAIVAAPAYLRLFGPEYEQAGQTVVIVVALGMLLAVAAGPVDVLLLMSGRSRTSLINNLLSLAVNIALNLMLIPSMGITGAAIAWAVALAVRNILPFIQVQRSLQVSGLSREFAMVSAASVAIFVVPMGLLRVSLGLDWLPTLLVLVAESAVYAALLWRWRDRLQLQALRRGRQRTP